jgi:hypothetical protein
MADQKSLKILGFSFASVTVAVMLLTAVVVQHHLNGLGIETGAASTTSQTILLR